MKRYFFNLIVFCLSIAAVSAQTAERALGQVIVQLAPGVGVWRPAEIVASTQNRNQGKDAALVWEQAVAPDWRIHLYSFDEQAISAEEVVSRLSKSADVENAQLNHRTYDRAIPNDAEWFRQTNMNLIQAPAAWDLTTGGVTAQGDTIVVAVLEKGYYREHPDYQANRWYNYDEIPDNDLDDDNNGFVDDHRGFDPRFDGDGPGNQSNHGTGVTGIVGAKGNNGTGISGVNWSVKVMNVSNVDYENEIEAAYYYVFQSRKLYNKTGGARGAFVVASNASFGIDKQKAAAHPIWCALYDSLGSVGIISIGATTNQNTNVDIEGDMPTSCPSPYLITVTNVNSSDIKQNSGYGIESIDLGAPGTGTVTTGYAGGVATYGILGGTSSSAPHVTGAVALIYSLPCPNLTANAITDPVVTAENIRDLIVNHLDDNLSLANVTKYGGRLNLFKPLEAAKQFYCNGGFGDLEITNAWKDDQQKLHLTGVLLDDTEHLLRIYDAIGRLMYEKILKGSNGLFNEQVFVETWPEAVYFATLSKGKKRAAKKFFKF
jgi:serine protease